MLASDTKEITFWKPFVDNLKIVYEKFNLLSKTDKSFSWITEAGETYLKLQDMGDYEVVVGKDEESYSFSKIGERSNIMFGPTTQSLVQGFNYAQQFKSFAEKIASGSRNFEPRILSIALLLGTLLIQ